MNVEVEAVLEQVDVAIVGGGMVGVSLALALPETLSIAVIESFDLANASLEKTLNNYQPSFDARATAISKSSEAFFQSAGVWADMAGFAEKILDVHVSDKGHWGSVMLSDKAEGLTALGYVIENACLGQVLLKALKQRKNIQLISPVTVASLSIKANGAEIQLQASDNAAASGVDAQSQLTAKLAIIADGANSSVCTKLGIATEVNRYEQMALVANIATDKPHKGIAYERFTDCGPMALLPLMATKEQAHRSALVWTLPNREAEKLMQADDAEFLAQLQKRFGLRQGKFSFVGKRFSYPLALSTAAEQVRERVVVLGNAAHSLHPVAGQGFNLALRDVAALVAVIEQALLADKAFYSIDVLGQYEKKQQQDQWLTMAFSDVLPQLFASNNVALRLLRGAGLLGLELLSPLKSNFVNFSTGFRRSSPLNRGRQSGGLL